MSHSDAKRVAITDDPIDVVQVTTAVQHQGAGAIATFVGTVRDVSEGRAVTLLEYEAYRPMAVAEMQRCVDEIEQAYRARGDVRLAVTHRIGALELGDCAVVCAASAPHRGEAFDACRALIDAIKARVPIWKREHGPDGAYWVGWVDARCEPDGHGHAHDHAHSHGHDHVHGRGHGESR
jgi:molybdopterin synthase catalytic subunit